MCPKYINTRNSATENIFLPTEKLKPPSRKHKFFVETGEDGIAGSISVVIQNSRVAEIQDFYIIEGPEDSGIRNKLLEKALDYCERRSIREVRAKIFPDLRKYFENRGFNAEKRLRDRFQRGEDILVVSCFLDRK